MNKNVVTLSFNDQGEITSVTGLAEVNKAIAETSEEMQATYRAYFERVEDKRNWKYPIDAIVTGTVDDMKIYKDAIAWFTGSIARISRVEKGKDTFHILADGYYKTIGA